MPDWPHGEYTETEVIYVRGASIIYYCVLPEEKFEYQNFENEFCN
jgi:hypothetical protein